MFTFKKNLVSSCRVTSSPVRPSSRLRLDTPPLALQSPAKRVRYESPQLALLDSPQRQKHDDEQQLAIVNCQTSIVSTNEPTRRQLLQLLHSPSHGAKVKVDTPPNTPEVSTPSKESIRDELQAELQRLNQEVEAKFQQIRDHLDRRAKSGYKRLILEDYMAMANKAQRDVRAICNEIYNPGVEMANNCSTRLEETKKNHASKFEKFTYEMTERMDATEITIHRKKDQLKHEIELYERTLITLKEEQEKRDQDAKEATVQLVEEVSAIEETTKEDSTKGDSGKEESMKEGDFSQGEGSDTEECIIVDKSGENDDADKTDIEEIADDEVVERPFTPCQAQRPV